MKMEGEWIKNPVNILYPLLVGQRLFSFSLFSLNSSRRLASPASSITCYRGEAGIGLLRCVQGIQRHAYGGEANKVL